MALGHEGKTTSQAAPPPPGSVTIRDVVRSQIVVGNGSIAIQMTVDGTAALEADSASRRHAAKQLQRLYARERPEPVGREEIIAHAVDELAAGHSVQLFGAPGVGKLAVATAVVRRLGARGLGGVQLLDADEPNTLTSLYSRLAWHFFEEPWYEPDEARLRSAAEEANVSGIVVIADCDLSPAEIDRLFGTFRRCVFLLTSSQQTMYSGNGVAYEVDPLSLSQTRELLGRELAASPVGVQEAQVEEAHRLAEGQTQRLIEYASFLRSAARTPGRNPRQRAGMKEQVALLISGLSEPSRRVLTALAGFGVAVPPDLFAPLIGLDATGVVPELTAAGLIASRGEVYAAAPDAADVLASTGQTADPTTAGDGLLAFLIGSARQTPPQLSSNTDLQLQQLQQLPRLCLAVARSLRDTGAPDRASALIRTAAPKALAAGKVDVWIRLVALGIQCATAANRPKDLEYFLTEQHTGALVRGDRATAAAAMTALAELLSKQAVAESLVREAGQNAGRRLLRRARKAAGIGHGAVGGVTALIVVVAVVTVVTTIDKPAAATNPGAAPTSTSTSISISASASASTPGTQASAVSAGLPAAPAAAGSPATPGTDCGHLPGGSDLMVISGAVTCASGYAVIEDYEAVPDKPGVTQPATVDGWACTESTEDAYSETGVGTTCRDGDKKIESLNPQLAPTAPPTASQN